MEGYLFWLEFLVENSNINITMYPKEKNGKMYIFHKVIKTWTKQSHWQDNWWKQWKGELLLLHSLNVHKGKDWCVFLYASQKSTCFHHLHIHFAASLRQMQMCLVWTDSHLSIKHPISASPAGWHPPQHSYPAWVKLTIWASINTELWRSRGPTKNHGHLIHPLYMFHWKSKPLGRADGLFFAV